MDTFSPVSMSGAGLRGCRIDGQRRAHDAHRSMREWPPRDDERHMTRPQDHPEGVSCADIALESCLFVGYLRQAGLSIYGLSRQRLPVTEVTSPASGSVVIGTL